MDYLVQLKTSSGKLINSDIVDADQVRGLLDVYADRLEAGFLSRGYFGTLVRDNDINPRGRRYSLKWTFAQACVLFQNKTFKVEVIPH